MAIDMFTPRKMLATLEQMKPAKTFLRNLFFSGSETSDTEKVDIDIEKGKRKMAPFVSPLHEGKVIERTGFITNTYTPPYIKMLQKASVQDIQTRAPGTNIYGSQGSYRSRLNRLTGKDMRKAEDYIARREEWMAAQLLNNGSVRVQGEGIDDLIDFRMEASHKIVLEGNDLWTDKTNSTPLEDLRSWRRLILKDSGIAPNTMVMGSAVVDAFLAHDDIRDALDTRRIDLGRIDPNDVGNGAIYYGFIKDVNIELYSYDEWYIPDNSDGETELPMLPENKIILGSTRARTNRMYGAIQDLEFNGLASVPRWPKSWITKDPSVRWLLVQSAPLLAMHQVDAFLNAQVVA